MKNKILSLAILASSGLMAQTVAPLKTFKNKEAKVRANNLHDLKFYNQTIELTAFLKKGSAEKLRFNTDLVLQSRIDTAFDFEADEKKKKKSFLDEFLSANSGMIESTSDLIKADVLEVSASDALSKTLGFTTIDKGRVGLRSSAIFSVQKGDIKLVTSTVNYGADDIRGNTTQTNTVFIVKEELKLKSDEGKNITYEFHSSNAEDIQVAFERTYSKTNEVTNKNVAYQNTRSLISEDGELLLVGKRRPIIKFGKAPSAEDILPVYYVFKMSPKTMDLIAQSKFSEPVSRGIIFRESLKSTGSILLVSAPTDFAGDRSPTDPDPKNFVFRIIGNDTKIKHEFNYEVPSGYTQFSQAMELADGSVVLIGVTNLEKKDKYINKTTLPMSYDACITLVIKDGKVVSSDVVTSKDFQSTYITAPGEKINSKNVYMPAYELKKNISTIRLADGGLVAAYTASALYGGGYAGDVILHFSAQGKLVAKYWLNSKNAFFPGIESQLFRKNDNELYLVTHVNNDKGGLEESNIVKIDLAAKTMGKRTLLGDEKHVLTPKFPYIQASESELQLFGFDKGGKEFWTQKVSF